MDSLEQGKSITILFLRLITIIAAIWEVSSITDKIHINEERQRGKTNAILCYETIYGVSTCIAGQNVNDIEQMYLSAKY